MNLRRQLLLVSLLLLALPWAGCQYVREMESALQSGQEQALLATTRAVATVMGDKPELIYPDLRRWHDPADTTGQLYASAARAPVIVDGYADGWEGPAQGSFGPVDYWAKTRGPLLYLLFSVRDAEVIYHDPRQARQATGDRLVLRSGGGREYVITTAAPGAVQGRVIRPGSGLGFEPRIRGHWQDSLDGYTIELQLPLALLAERLGFYVVNDSGRASPETTPSNGNINPGQRIAPWLIYSPQSLQALLAPFAGPGIKLRVVDSKHWLVAEAGNIEREPVENQAPWVLRAIYRAILNGDSLPAIAAATLAGQSDSPEASLALSRQSSADWYSDADMPGLKLLSAAAPVFSGGEVAAAVVATQNSEQYLSLTDRAFSRLLYYSLTAVLISALGLLGYASWLSLRIRQLSRASSQVIRADGSISSDFPVSRSKDEIGELSRQYAQLLERLREYTDYLRSLSRKLSHELRTPIAVIQSSLDNLEQEPETGQVYLERARQGLTRLANILTAMSEATRLEESVQSNQRETFDLVALCQALLRAYQGVYSDHVLVFESEREQWPMEGVPDLLAQMLDKLVDNATSFTPAGGRITLSLGDSSLSVKNEGPLLPLEMQQQLFDSMVSVRDKSDRVHLGLGLHIVRLIVDFHGASVQASNLEDGSGVIFTVEFPAAAGPIRA
jgi:two-component system sensor histidine kinase ChvG